MAVTVDTPRFRAIHPMHAVLLAGSFTLFLSALLNDLAYSSTYDVQWTNFASWLIVGGLVLGGIALVFALADLRHAVRRSGSSLMYLLLLVASWIVGFVNAVVHAKDAWAAMPESLVLSVIATVLAGMATWLGFSSLRTGDIA